MVHLIRFSDQAGNAKKASTGCNPPAVSRGFFSNAKKPEWKDKLVVTQKHF